MRSIKFRIRYNQILKDFHDEGLNEIMLSSDTYTQIVSLEELLNGSLYNLLKEVKIISVDEFTGLHDKNGKEIYEGYIVKSDWNNNEVFEVFMEDIFYKLGEDPDLCEHLEIIGNIYENPELLKGDKK